MIQRRRDYDKREPSRDAHKIYIVPVRLELAIENAERNFQTEKESQLLDYSSEVYMLGKEIDGFVKSDLKKLGNKLK